MNLAASTVFLAGVAVYVCLPYTVLANFVALEYVFLGAAVGGALVGIDYTDGEGQLFLLSVLGVAAAEAALGLALLVQLYRLRGDIQTLSYPPIKA